MKRLPTSFFAAFLALSVSGKLAAADPESSFGLAPSTVPQVPVTPPSQPTQVLPLIPDAVPPVDNAKKDAADQARSDRTSMAEDKLRKRIQIRQAEAKAEREPDLQALKARAKVAHTDFEQRKLYIEYYTAFCERVSKFDKTIKKEDIDALRTMDTGRFVQVRIAPTVDPATFQTKGN